MRYALRFINFDSISSPLRYADTVTVSDGMHGYFLSFMAYALPPNQKKNNIFCLSFEGENLRFSDAESFSHDSVPTHGP